MSSIAVTAAAAATATDVSAIRVPEVPSERRGCFVRLCRWYSRRRFGGRDVGPMRVYSHHGTLLFGTGAMELALERARVVPARVKALAEIQAARMVGCLFCIDIGSALGRGHGVTSEQLLALDDFEQSPLFDARERCALRLAMEMTRQPTDVPEALVAEARALFGDAGVVELAGVIAWENFRARFNDAFGLVSEGFLPKGGACPMPLRPRPMPRESAAVNGHAEGLPATLATAEDRG